MAIRIGHASGSEDHSGNGVKGDQTQKEVKIGNWYSSPWVWMAVHPDEKVREKIAKVVEAGCLNDNIGYGQRDRNTLYEEAKKVNFDLSKIKTPCNTDCSAFMNCVCAAVGLVTYGANGWTTKNMREPLEKAGFKIIEDKTKVNDKKYTVRGAILLGQGHTVCCLDNGECYEEMLEKKSVVNKIVAAAKEAVNVVPKIPTPAPAAPKKPSPGNGLGNNFKVTANALNVREEPTTNSKVLRVVHKDEVYAISEIKGSWGKLQDSKGWISLNYAKLI